MLQCFSRRISPIQSTTITRFSKLKMSTKTTDEKIMFGPFEVTSQVCVFFLFAPNIFFFPIQPKYSLTKNKKKVFLKTPHSIALVNLKPLLPGHVLVAPHTAASSSQEQQQQHTLLATLSAAEITDLFTTVQRVQRMLRRHEPRTTAFNIAVQDGRAAGQTVPHVHVHVIPRYAEDGVVGDEVHELLAGEEGNVGGALWDAAAAERPRPSGGFERVEEGERRVRGMEEMEAEAEVFRNILKEMEKEEEEH